MRTGYLRTPPCRYTSLFIRDPSASPFPPNFQLPPPSPNSHHPPPFPQLPSSSASIAYIYFHIYASNPHHYIASFSECIDDANSWRCISISLHLLPLPPPRSLSYSFAITHPSTTLPRQECRCALSLRSYYNMGLLQNHELTYHDCEYVFISRERVGRSAYYRVFIFCQS